MDREDCTVCQDREERARLRGFTELFHLLGGDNLADKIRSTLYRNGVPSAEALKSTMKERPEAVEGFKGIGPVAMGRIRERLGLKQPEQQ